MRFITKLALASLLTLSAVQADTINPLDQKQGATVSAYRVANVTPNDDYIFGVVNRAIWVGTGGNLAVITLGGDRVVITNVQDGSLLPLVVQRILSTGTTATSIQIWW